MGAAESANQSSKQPWNKKDLFSFLIPALDIIDGKCVRLTEGDYNQKKIYDNKPLEVAKRFEEAGLKRLHLVDLDGAKKGKVENWKVLEEIAAQTRLEIDFGGGVKSSEDVKRILDTGASMVTIGSVAVKNRKEMLDWIGKFDPEKFFIGADVRDGKLSIGGWLETTEIKLDDFLMGYLSEGISQFFCTDISRDGKMAGPADSLYQQVCRDHPGIQLVASGGIRDMDDLLLVRAAGCTGAIVGKALYEGRIRVESLSKFQNE